MGRSALRGALIGAAVGLVLAMALGLVVIGTDDISNIADTDDLPALYVIAGLIGVLVGSSTGAAGLVLAARVSGTATGSGSRRRLLGALAAAVSSAAVTVVAVAPFFGDLGVLVVLAMGVVGGLAAWLALPTQVDLESTPDPLVGARTTPAEAPVSTPRRVLVTVLVSGAGAFVATNLVMSVLPLDRDVADVVAAVVLGVVFVVLAVTVWRGSARMVAPRPDGPDGLGGGDDDLR